MSKPFATKVVVSDEVTIRTTDGNTSIKIDQTDGILAEVTDLQMAIQLHRPTNTIFPFNPNGRILSTCGDFVVDADVKVALDGDDDVEQTLSTILRVVTAPGLASLYPEFTNADAPGLVGSSRLNLEPDALGTTIESLFTNAAAVPNVPGRMIWLQNIGTAVGQNLILPSQSVGGTVGGQFFGPGASFAIPPGGGVAITFDDQVGTDGFWLVRGT